MFLRGQVLRKGRTSSGDLRKNGIPTICPGNVIIFVYRQKYLFVYWHSWIGFLFSISTFSFIGQSVTYHRRQKFCSLIGHTSETRKLLWMLDDVKSLRICLTKTLSEMMYSNWNSWMLQEPFITCLTVLLFERTKTPLCRC